MHQRDGLLTPRGCLLVVQGLEELQVHVKRTLRVTGLRTRIRARAMLMVAIVVATHAGVHWGDHVRELPWKPTNA